MTDMIFVLEDDDSIRNLMLYTLHTAGFEAAGFPDSVLFGSLDLRSGRVT